MATYYVRKSGSDAAAGTSAGAAWLTIGKALAAGSTVAAGDTIYVGAGVYREVVTVAISGTAGNVINVIGDVDGAKTGDAGEVQWTAYTTNDTTAPSASAVATLTSRSYLAFSNLVVIGGGTASCFLGASGVHDLTWTDCAILNPANAGGAIQMTGDAGVVMNMLVDRCVCLSNVSSCITFTTTSIGSGADWDNTNLVRNSLVWSVAATAVLFTATGGLSKHGGGQRVANCTIMGSTAVNGNSAGMSTTIPNQVQNSLIIASTGITTPASVTLTEDHNLIFANTARTNVVAGTGSISDKSYAPLLSVGQEGKFGGMIRSLLMPTAGSPALGFGNAASPPTVDFLNRPRPSGAITNAVGYLERHDNGVHESIVTDNGVVLSGVADHALNLPVTTDTITLSVRVRYDANHGTTNKPQVILDANGAIGVSAQTKTATVGTDTFETLTFSAITPTGNGWVRLRLISRGNAANGLAYFDRLAVA